MHVRHATVAVAALLLLAACAGSDDAETDAAPEASATTSAALTPEEAWEQSLCAGVDMGAVGEVLDVDVVSKGGTSATGGTLPVRDTCSFQVGSEDARSAVTFGSSVGAVDDAGWDALLDTYERTQGQYVDLVPLDDVGDGGVVVFTSAFAHSDGRVVSVSYSGQPQADAEQLAELLRLGVAQTSTLAEPEPIRSSEECDGLLDAATTTLGAEPTLVRGLAGEDAPTCVWGTDTASITVAGASFGDDAADQVTMMDDFGDAEPVDGLGVEARWSSTVDGSVVRWATEGGLLVSVTSDTGTQVEKADAVALAEAAAPLYP